MPVKRRGLTDFTFSRFLVPYLCGYSGPALFLDADMLALCDIWEVMDHFDPSVAVQVVKVPERFEWPALMLFNCDECRELSLDLVEQGNPFAMDWGEVGELPPEFHHIVGYHEPKEAKIAHFTMGIPEWPEVRPCEYQQEWHAEKQAALGNCSWLELMGNSVHAKAILSKYL